LKPDGQAASNERVELGFNPAFNSVLVEASELF
jgi:hypothetical protein